MRVLSRILIACIALTAAPAFAQDTTTAQAFLQSIYKNYGKGGPGVNFDGSKARHIFSSSLLGLLHADERALGPDEVGVLDGDPLCSCQDWDALHDLKIALSPQSEDGLKASVSFALFQSKAASEQSLRSLEITLVRHRGQWRIDNILDQSDLKAPFDLRAELKKEIRQSRQRAAATPTPRQTRPRF
ncbi:MAG TPA: DUF3828 domain-containing protein [Terracidiphilus sp.]|nr:DUF3828 domain-containing protein [Terracidiphilus sp.]